METSPSSPFRRHGCLTAWLAFMIIANAGTVIFTPLSIAGIEAWGIHLSPVALGVIIVCSLANIAFAIALFKWKKLGFYGFVVTSIAALITNLSLGMGIGSSLVGLVGIGVLYWVLNMGGPSKAWPRLH